MEYKKLGANVRKYRKIAGLTQEELAEIIGCSNSHIGQIENGRGVPSLDMMVKIANALGVPVCCSRLRSSGTYLFARN